MGEQGRYFQGEVIIRFFLSSPEDMLTDFKEREARKSEKERNIHWLLLICA